MMDKGMVSRLIAKMMTMVVDRNVEVNFSHLGKGNDYSIAIQTSLYEFDENVQGPKGPMYITLNNYLLQDTSELISTIDKIIESRK
tara:strand:- start:251 stop:508 length:258 start_codon:yes stop_codon:yes gene_type:complete